METEGINHAELFFIEFIATDCTVHTMEVIRREKVNWAGVHLSSKPIQLSVHVYLHEGHCLHDA